MSNIGNKDILARNLKHYIAKSGKDRRELAEIWGFPYSTVTEWINGKKYPRIDRIEIMADYFGILKSDLIEDKKEKPTAGDGLSENKKALMDFAMSVPDDKAAMILKVIRSIVEDD
jgi:repressor LexA